MSVRPFIFLILWLTVAFAAPTEPPTKVDTKNVEAQKSAASVEEQNKAKTFHLLNSHSQRPTWGYPSYPVPYPWTYGSYHQSAPLVSTAIATPTFHQVQPASYHWSSLPASVPVAQPIIHQQAPVVSQTTYTKPTLSFTPTLVKKPTYTISQEVLHQPVINEEVKVVRRPVIAYVDQVIHSPSFTEYQQVFKLPTHTAHVIKKPTYSSVQHEILEKPVVLNSEQYHVVQKPTAQVFQYPAQYVQPYNTEVVHVPSVSHQTETQTTVHHPPAVAVQPAVVQPALSVVHPASSVSYLPSTSYGLAGSSLIGSESSFGSYGSSFGGFGSGLSGYGSSLSGFGSGLSGYGSSLGFGSGLSGFGSSFGSSEDAGYYLTPSTCRGGDCQVTRDAEGHLVVMPSSGNINEQMMTYSYNPNVVPASTISNPQMLWPNYATMLKNTAENGGTSQQPTQARANDPIDDALAPSFESQPDSQLAELAKHLLNNPDVQKSLEEIYESKQISAKSAESDNKIKEMLSKLTDEEKEKVRSMIEMKKAESSSTTPASVQPTVDPKKDTPKQ